MLVVLVTGSYDRITTNIGQLMIRDCQWRSGILHSVSEYVGRGFSLPRGIRTGNPGLLTQRPRWHWRGQCDIANDGHLIFSHPMHGVRAMVITLVNLIEHYKLDTLYRLGLAYEGILPVSGTGMSSYVAARLLIEDTDTIDFDLNALEVLKGFIAYLNRAEFEGHSVTGYYTDDVLRTAITTSHLR